MGLLKEFKEFALRGNVIDMAVGLVIGAAFGEIVSSLVKDVIMPPLGMLTSGVDFSASKLQLSPAADGKAAVELSYGLFINSIVKFLMAAVAIFMVVKVMNTLKRKQVEAPPPEPPKEILLLTEIRDALKARK